MERHMNKDINIDKKELINKASDWIEGVEENSLFEARNKNLAISSVVEASEKESPIPFILTLCPAIDNLVVPNSKGQTRELTPLTKDNPRLKIFVKELVSFMIFTKKKTGLDSEIFLIFSDSLEEGAKNMFTNSECIEDITISSKEGIRKAFFEFDQENQGLFQENRIRIPKLFAQSEIPGFSQREKLIDRFIFKMWDPITKEWEEWAKHLKANRNDDSFISTGWQNASGARQIWVRTRFLLAEFMADGVFLPDVMKKIKQKRFPLGMPNPIFIASTTRKAGVEMEASGFESCGLISPFNNIGRWTDSPNNSSWIDKLNTDIIK